MYSEKTYGGKIANVANKAVVASVQEVNFIPLDAICERKTSTQKSLHLHDFAKVEKMK